MACRAREGYQPVRQTVLFLVLLQKMGPLGTFLMASRKHGQTASQYIHLYTPRPGYIYIAKTTSHSHPQKQSFSLRHNKALACIPLARTGLLFCYDSWQAGLVKVVSLFGRQFSSWSSYRRWVRRARFSWRAESTDRPHHSIFICILLGPTTYRKDLFSLTPTKTKL